MATVQSISENDSGEKKSPSLPIDDGPPSSSSKPKPATSSSLFSSMGKDLQSEQQAGLGSEGSNPSMIAMMGLARIQSGIQMLSTTLPGIAPVLGDLMGRLQTIVPQAVTDLSNGGTGLFPSMGMQPQQPPMGGMPPQPMAPPPPGAPPMAGGGMPPPGVQPAPNMTVPPMLSNTR